MKFSQMRYERIDVDAFKAAVTALMAEFETAKTVDEAVAAYDRIDREFIRAMSMRSLAYIRNSLDTRDEFYSAEQDYMDEVSPLLQEVSQEVSRMLLASPFRAELEEKWGSVMFLNTEIALKAFSPELIPLMQEENKLTTEYDKLIASAQIEYDGKTLTLAQISPYHENAARAVRKSSLDAKGTWFSQHRERLDGIFDELVKLRTAMAATLGYKNYIELGYYQMTRNCYNADMVKKFRDAVKKYIVPVAGKLIEAQAERIHAPGTRLSMYDAALQYLDGNANPQGTPDEIFEAGKKMYHELSPDTAEFIDFMLENELFDVLTRPGKSGGGYCDDIPLYEAQFIFANFNGTSADVDVLTHEAGHAFAGYCGRGIFPYDLRQYTYETAETHSMSMEFFTHPWMELFFGAQTAKYLYTHTADALIFLPYGCMVDEFQHIVYERPELTPAERNEVWKKLEAEYRPYLDFSEPPFYSEGRRWQAQAHIYVRPFYYIDYCLAQTNALSFWTLDLQNHAEAWDTYRRFIGYAGTKTFTDLVALSGLPSPFEEQTLKAIADGASKWLEENKV
ncbi:MAG: M3 family oligoendopeptidase [Oscillospiraceae bacterium]|jgi:M3 family oligoendopeptidase|nr:M3 family oligoendopeptidase [Oscillospiraceae bacterium]